MNQPSMPDLETIFKRIPMLPSTRIEDLQVKRLSGFTNHNFHIKGAHADWVLRIPRAETNQFIDRAIEAHNSDIAVLMGLAPECIWRDNTGLSLCQTLSNTRPIKPLDLQNSQIRESLVSKLTRLHQCGAEFGGRVNLEELLTGFYQLAQKPQQRLLKSSYHKAKKKIKNLAQEDGVPVPSHNDLVLENILLDDTKRIWLIDWEYSSMASPYWDLATLCNAADFSHKQSAGLLADYQRQHHTLKLEVLIEYRYIVKTISACWMAAFNHKDPGA